MIPPLARVRIFIFLNNSHHYTLIEECTISLHFNLIHNFHNLIMEAESRKTGLKINVKKTKILINRSEQIHQIKIGNAYRAGPKGELLFRSSNRKEWSK
jgi:hypothetical protein